MSFISEKYDKLLEEMKGLRGENRALRKEMTSLREENRDIKESYLKLEQQVSEVNQYGRRCNLEIHAIGYNGDPRNENVLETLKKTAEDIGVDFTRASSTVFIAFKLGKMGTRQRCWCNSSPGK